MDARFDRFKIRRTFLFSFFSLFLLHIAPTSARQYVKLNKFLHNLCAFFTPFPPICQDSAPPLDQFPLNPDELLMSTFFFLLMGKSFEMDFF